MAEDTTTNALGLDFSTETVADAPQQSAEVQEDEQQRQKTPRKLLPYINPDRVSTGGAQRVRL